MITLYLSWHTLVKGMQITALYIAVDPAAITTGRFTAAATITIIAIVAS